MTAWKPGTKAGPMSDTVAAMTPAIRDATSAYSTAVAPDSKLPRALRTAISSHFNPVKPTSQRVR